jgi:drug/metabolite transporter (DMT)-like permease
MSEPDEVRFACIGCGAMNPAGAAVCSGCGHVFAGPVSGMAQHPKSAPALPESRNPYRPIKPVTELTLLGCLARMFSIAITMIAAFFAFVVAFVSTCTSGGINQDMSGLAWLAGLAAAGTVIGFALWIRTIRKSHEDTLASERRKENR